MQPMIQVIGTEWHTDYGRGEATTCRVALKNLSNFAATVYAQVYLGYRAWTIWYDGSSRVWVRFDLPAGGQITRDGHPVVKSDCPYGTMIGQVDVFPQQSRDNMLASAGAPGAVNIVEEPEVHEIVHLPVTGGRGWRLDRDYNISWCKLKFTVHSIETPPVGNRRVSLKFIRPNGVSTRVIACWSNTIIQPGNTWEHESDPQSAVWPILTRDVQITCDYCEIKDLHIWWREAGSVSQVQALLSKSWVYEVTYANTTSYAFRW